MTKTVHEIITYLKNNHDVGMGYGFMPPDVRAWCEAQPDKGILQVYDAEKKDWKPVRNAADFKFNDARIYSIPDTYTMYPEFPGDSVVKNPPANAGDMGGGVDLLEQKWHFTRVLAWKIPWTEEPGGLQSTGSQRVRHD